MRSLTMPYVAALAIALLAAPMAALAQIGTGQVNGTVTDPRGPLSPLLP